MRNVGMIIYSNLGHDWFWAGVNFMGASGHGAVPTGLGRTYTSPRTYVLG